jgi:hypothetical protein
MQPALIIMHSALLMLCALQGGFHPAFSGPSDHKKHFNRNPGRSAPENSNTGYRPNKPSLLDVKGIAGSWKIVQHGRGREHNSENNIE